MMNKKHMVEALTAHAEKLVGRSDHITSNDLANDLTNEERKQLTPLIQLSERLHQNLKPIQPSAAFVSSLGKELKGQAQRQIAMRKRKRRVLVISAAAVGSVVSIASIVGAILLVIARLRARSQTQALQA